MKKKIIIFAAVLILMFCFCPRAAAYDLDSFEGSVNGLYDSLPPETKDKLADMGINSGLGSMGSLSTDGIFSLIISEFSLGLSGPAASLLVLVCVLLLSSLLEGYTFSLRYTETKEIMQAVTTLAVLTALLHPIAELIDHSCSVISDASAFMLAYVPVMMGIIAFSGRVMQAGGCFTTVMAAAQIVSQLASRFFAPALCAYFALSVCSGVTARVRLKGVSDMMYNALKWSLTGVMTVFSAVLSLQAALAGAADTAAGRAARFTLSSFIPLVGGAVSEAYKTISGSVGILRSGVGVFSIIALLAAIAPALIRAALWLLCVSLAAGAAEALGAGAPRELLSSVINVLKALIAILISTATVFIVSSAVLMSMGGSA